MSRKRTTPAPPITTAELNARRQRHAERTYRALGDHALVACPHAPDIGATAWCTCGNGQRSNPARCAWRSRA